MMQKTLPLVILCVAPSLLLNIVLLTHYNAQQKETTTTSTKISTDRSSMYKRSIHIPYFKDTKNNSYSSFRCVGNDNDALGDDYNNRLCVFMNVCYSVDTEKIHYYRRSPKPILFDMKHGRFYNFTNNGRNIVAMHSGATLLQMHHFSWAPTIHEGSAPKEEDVHRLSGQLYSLWSPGHADMNFGHLCWEDFASLLYGMKRMDIYTPHLKVLYYDIHNAHFHANHSQLYYKFRDTFLPAITDQAMEDMHEHLKAAANGKKHVCFDDLIVGGRHPNFWFLNYNMGFEPLFTELRNRVMTHMGVDPHARPTKHQITVLVKTKGNWGYKNSTRKTTIVNYQETIDFIRKTYPTIPIQVIAPQNMSMYQQLEVMTKTTILITPSGGISFLAPFLPEGAHLLTTDFLHELGSASRDGRFMNYWPHFKRLYYQVYDETDVEFDNEQAATEKNYKDGASVIIKMDRLKELIDSALEHML